MGSLFHLSCLLGEQSFLPITLIGLPLTFSVATTGIIQSPLTVKEVRFGLKCVCVCVCVCISCSVVSDSLRSCGL